VIIQEFIKMMVLIFKIDINKVLMRD